MNMNTNMTNEISTTSGNKLKVTCVERRYKVIDSNISFVIVAKKELDEDTTEKLLHEDMELKTFLANYEIADITFPSSIKETKIPKKKPEFGRIKEESEEVKNRREAILITLKRRELFDSLDLPEEFLVKNYTEAIEKIGMKITNPTMPYDDLKWLKKKGKIKLIKKTDRGVSIYKKMKNVETEDEKESNEIQSDIQSNILTELLPGKDTIDKIIKDQ